MKIKRVTVKKNERGLLLRNGDFDRVLQPGTHWLIAGLDTLRVELFALEQPALEIGEIGPAGATLLLELALHADLFVLGLENQLFLLCARLGHDGVAEPVHGARAEHISAAALDSLARNHLACGTALSQRLIYNPFVHSII